MRTGRWIECLCVLLNSKYDSRVFIKKEMGHVCHEKAVGGLQKKFLHQSILLWNIIFSGLFEIPLYIFVQAFVKYFQMQKSFC